MSTRDPIERLDAVIERCIKDHGLVPDAIYNELVVTLSDLRRQRAEGGQHLAEALRLVNEARSEIDSFCGVSADAAGEVPGGPDREE